MQRLHMAKIKYSRISAGLDILLKHLRRGLPLMRQITTSTLLQDSSVPLVRDTLESHCFHYRSFPCIHVFKTYLISFLIQNCVLLHHWIGDKLHQAPTKKSQLLLSGTLESNQSEETYLFKFRSSWNESKYWRKAPMTTTWILKRFITKASLLTASKCSTWPLSWQSSSHKDFIVSDHNCTFHWSWQIRNHLSPFALLLMR